MARKGVLLATASLNINLNMKQKRQDWPKSAEII